MWKKLHRSWQIVPTWLKTLPVVFLLLGLSILHARFVIENPHLLPVVQRLFFLPLFLASLVFGLRGGLAAAFLISLNFLPDMTLPSEDMTARLVLGLEVGLYFLTGIVTGAVVDREAKEAERLKRAENLALLGQAAAAVAHEMKTPLIAIGGFARRIQKDLTPDHPHYEKCRIIVEQTAHMEGLLLEILDFSRPVRLRREPFDLVKVGEEAVGILDLQAREGGIEVILEKPAGPVELVGDPGRIKQVAINLIQNAVQASHPGDKVRVRVEAREDGGMLEVQDEGQGISPQDQARIFTPFFTTKHKGTGLGLAISGKIVEAHGGRLELTSELNQGSLFRVILPKEPPENNEVRN